MRLFISPSEPTEIKRLGRTSPKPEKHGVDIYWFNNGLKFGIQRKQFPGDFLSSLYDERLYKEMAQMKTLDRAMLIVEGFGRWTDSGHLIDRRRFSKRQMFNLINSIAYEHGVPVTRVRNIDETVQAITAFYAWSEKTEHSALEKRPNPAGMWGTADSREWQLHLMQSFDGIGPKQAARIVDHFGKVPLKLAVSPEELRKVQGVGKVTVDKILKALG